jgi:hypothetical protein
MTELAIGETSTSHRQRKRKLPMTTFSYVRSYKGRAGVVQTTEAKDREAFLETLKIWTQQSLDRHGVPVYTYEPKGEPNA